MTRLTADSSGAIAGAGRFWSLFAVQTAAAAVVLWNGVPVYKRLLLAKQSPEPYLIPVAIALASTLLASYWSGRRQRHTISSPKSALGAHVLLFSARLNFVYVSAMFSVVFLVQFDNLELRFGKLCVLVAVMFAMFCYTLQLEWIGRRMPDDGMDARR